MDVNLIVIDISMQISQVAIFSKQKLHRLTSGCRSVHSFLSGVAHGGDSSEEGAKIWFSGYCKYQKSPKSRFSPSEGELACSDRGP